MRKHWHESSWVPGTLSQNTSNVHKISTQHLYTDNTSINYICITVQWILRFLINNHFCVCVCVCVCVCGGGGGVMCRQLWKCVCCCCKPFLAKDTINEKSMQNSFFKPKNNNNLVTIYFLHTTMKASLNKWHYWTVRKKRNYTCGHRWGSCQHPEAIHSMQWTDPEWCLHLQTAAPQRSTKVTKVELFSFFSFLKDSHSLVSQASVLK